MNLREVYEIFYPGKSGSSISVWSVSPKYRSKKDFFEELLPAEVRWINGKIWNDKARRSRFLSDCKKEARFLAALRTLLYEQPGTISRMEGKANDLLYGQISEKGMNERFSQTIEEEGVEISRNLRTYLFDSATNRLKTKWGNVLTFYVLLAVFPEEINQIYVHYMYDQEHKIYLRQEGSLGVTRKDCSLFQYEYPPDMGIFTPGERINHTWVFKNVGDVVWENRYYECNQSMMELDEKDRIIRVPGQIYPGDIVSPSISLYAPEKPGNYVVNWKMKDSEGNVVFPEKLGIGLHFTVTDATEETAGQDGKAGNYRVIEEVPRLPVTTIAGNQYSHTWVIQNTGETIWNEYRLECINGDNFSYVKSELCVPFKERVMPDEKIFVNVEFATPPIEGIYSMAWQIVKKDGTPAFQKNRRLEILLNLI